MGRILFSRLIGTLLMVFLAQTTFAQHTYYVFKKSGEPLFDANKNVERGTYFQEQDTLKLRGDDYVMLVNQEGELFELNIPNTYSFKDIFGYKVKMEYTSFTKKYFTYVWRQFTNKRKSKQEAGVVYREGRNIQAKMPVDSAKIYKPNVWFSWDNKTDNSLVYFFLKDLESGHMTKIGTRSDSLLLQIDNNLLKPGNRYEWSVASSSFPNLNELEFNALAVINDEEYLNIKEEVTILIKTFKILGFSKAEIQEAICLDYKFCSF